MEFQNLELNDLSIFRLLTILIVSISILYGFARKQTKNNRFALSVLTLFVFIYSGFGSSYKIVPIQYLGYYSAFLFIFIYSFSKIAFGKLKIVLYHKDNNFPQNYSFSKPFLNRIIYLYLFLILFDALYPEFSLTKLLSIKPPELIFTTELLIRDAIQNIIYYLLLFITPFYFISLSGYIKKPLYLFILLFLPLLLIYSKSGYIGRSTILPYILIYVVTIYQCNTEYRKTITWIVLAIFLPLVFFFIAYSYWRLGQEMNDLTFEFLLQRVFSTEFGFPLFFKETFQNNYRLEDPSKFFLWLFTLPIPGFLKPSSFMVTINYDLAELYTGLSRNSENYFVILSGGINESIFVFGKYFFFILPLLTGSILGSVFKIIKSITQNVVLKNYFIFFIGLVFARAGSGSVLPYAINGFVLIYIYLIIHKLSMLNKASMNSVVSSSEKSL